MPDPNFQLPAGAQIAAAIHTHSYDMDPWPETGDYQSANSMKNAASVYGITESGVGVLRHGAAFMSQPEQLEGTPPTKRSGQKGPKNGQTTCTVK